MTDDIDQQKRRFLINATCAVGGVGAACALSPFVTSWLPSAKAEAAGAPVQVDLSALEPGQQVTVEWRGKPVWIIRRTKQMIEKLKHLSSQLRDPNSNVDQQPDYAKNAFRSRKPDYLILVGVCTHLGCIPNYMPEPNTLSGDWPGGFYCPCHGSTFDLAGRVFKGVPAPINLAVPPHKFVNDTLVIIGEDA